MEFLVLTYKYLLKGELMKNLVLGLVVAVLSMSASAQRDGRIIKVENFDIYKNPITLDATAKEVRVADFKFKKAVKQRITYWATCYENDNDRKAVEKRSYPCKQTRNVYEKVARVKMKYDVMVPYYRRGEVVMVKETKRTMINVMINSLPDYASEMLEDRRILFPNRDKYRALANELFTVESTMTRTGLAVKLNRN